MVQTLEELVSIASNSGGMKLDAKKWRAKELERIAAASGIHRAQIFINNSDSISLDDKLRISRAGNGNIIFDIDE